MTSEAREAEREKWIRLTEAAAAEPNYECDHHRLCELELQANRTQPSSSISLAHPPSEANSSFNIPSGLGQFTLIPYRESIEPIDQYIKQFSRLAKYLEISVMYSCVMGFQMLHTPSSPDYHLAMKMTLNI